MPERVHVKMQAIRLAALCLAAALLAGCEVHVSNSGYVACEATIHGYYLDHRDLDGMAASLADHLDHSYADSFTFTLPDFFNLFHAYETTRIGDWNIADDYDVVATCTT